MEVSPNFAFLTQEFPHAAESASFAERHVYGDPRASCFHARHALEHLLKRVYKVEKGIVRLTLRLAQCRDEHSPAPLPSDEAGIARAAELREGGFRTNPVGIIAEDDQQFGRGVGAHTALTEGR